LIPAGVLVTVPLPETATVSLAGGVAEKVAETDSLLASTSLHVAPLHAPPKPAKLEPEAAVAVSVTDVPLAKFAAHLPGQLMPAGALVTVPLPVSATINCACWELGGGTGFEPPPQPDHSVARERNVRKTRGRKRTDFTYLRKH
jgi:hypothetical protein